MTYSEQLNLVNDLLNTINAEEKAIKDDLKAEKITRDQAEELMEMPLQWQEYRYQLGFLQGMKAAQ